MGARNKKRQPLGSAMRVLKQLSTFAFTSLLCSVIACSSQNANPHSGLVTIFDERPFYLGCADRPGPPTLGGGSFTLGGSSFLTGSPQAPYKRTRLDTLDLPRFEVPALTIAAEYMNWIDIAASAQDHWTVHYCAEGSGNTPEDANSSLQKTSMQRTGSLLTLNSTGAGGVGNLLLEAPAGAPITVHSFTAVEVHDVSGPLRISALGRAVVLNTTGRVDVAAMMIDFAGSQGTVTLNAPREIGIKLTATQFHGTIAANAEKEIRAYFPPGSQTPVNVLVGRPKDFICLADFCSAMKKSREDSLYRFTYGNAGVASDGIGLRSEESQVVLETVE